MGIPTRLLSREFIQLVINYDASIYYKKYIEKKIVENPFRPYCTNSELDQHIDFWSKSKEILLAQMMQDSKVLIDIPIPIKPITEINSEEICAVADTIKDDVADTYPLLDQETVTAVTMYYLENDWQSLSKGTFVCLRETNYSKIFLTLPDYRFNIETNKLFPSILPTPTQLNTETIPKMISLSANNDHLMLRSIAAAAKPLSDIDPHVYVNLTFELISTLSWATPFGPFISAGITFLQAIINIFWPEQSMSMADWSDNIVKRIQESNESEKLKTNIEALTVFSKWLNKIKDLINVSDPLTFRMRATEENGILPELTAQFSNRDKSMFSLIEIMLNDLSGEIKPFDSSHDWQMALYKLKILFNATTLFFVALKMKGQIIGTLADLGFDFKGDEIVEGKGSESHDNTLQFLAAQVEEYSKRVMKSYKYVMERRKKNIEIKPGETKVAYGDEDIEIGKSIKKIPVIEHDGIYSHHGTLFLNPPDRYFLVRDLSDIAVKEETGVSHNYFKVDAQVYIPDSHSISPVKPTVYTICQYNWERSELHDSLRENSLINFVLHDYSYKTGYIPKPHVAQEMREQHVQQVLAELEADLRIKEGVIAWKQNVEALGKSIRPTIPENLNLVIKEWRGECVHDSEELWNKPNLEVRYRFSLQYYGLKSGLSNNQASTAWVLVRPQKDKLARTKPVIIGFPKNIEALKPIFVKMFSIYREFRFEENGVKKISISDNPIKNILCDQNGNFPSEFVDTISTKHATFEIEKTSVAPHASFFSSTLAMATPTNISESMETKESNFIVTPSFQ